MSTTDQGRRPARSLKRKKFDDEIVMFGNNNKSKTGEEAPSPTTSTAQRVGSEISKEVKPVVIILHWNVHDDYKLIKNMEQVNDICAVFQCVRFSRIFTKNQIKDRWYSLLYEDDAARIACACFAALNQEDLHNLTKNLMWSFFENDCLYNYASPSGADPPTLDEFAKLLDENLSVFAISRTSTDLQRQWINLQKHYNDPGFEIECGGEVISNDFHDSCAEIMHAVNQQQHQHQHHNLSQPQPQHPLSLSSSAHSLSLALAAEIVHTVNQQQQQQQYHHQHHNLPQQQPQHPLSLPSSAHSLSLALADDDILRVSRELQRVDRKQKKKILILESLIAATDQLPAELREPPPFEFPVSSNHLAAFVNNDKNFVAFMTAQTVTVGRSMEGNKVDIDFSPILKHQNEISRVQMIVKLKYDGNFYIRNVGKRTIFVNDIAIKPQQREKICHDAVIEIGSVSVTFHVNERILNEIRRDMAV